MRLRTVYDIWHFLHQNWDKYLAELNIAPAFVGTTMYTYLTTIIIELCRLFDKKTDRSLFNFLQFVSDHQDLFSTDEMKRRKNLDDSDWFVALHKPADKTTVAEYLSLIESKESVLTNLRYWRDKQFAHIDKEYFENPSSIAKTHPITYDDLRTLINLTEEILNRWSSAYDGMVQDFAVVNRLDIDRLLRKLQAVRR